MALSVYTHYPGNMLACGLLCCMCTWVLTGYEVSGSFFFFFSGRVARIFQFCKTANADFSFKFDILNMGIITACAYSAVIYIGIRHDKLDNI